MDLVHKVYHRLLKSDCELYEMDLENVSLGLLCHLLERNETNLSEGQLYNLCLRY